MGTLDNLLANNRNWARDVVEKDPAFFSRLAEQQNPDYLWIGCSDSRVPANQILGLQPGEIFVHRNIANLVQTSDLNCLSVIQFAVEFLKVKHIIVCGHFGCGGVMAAVQDTSGGLIDYWIWNIKLIMKKHQAWLGSVPAEKLSDIVCELNVIEQALTLSHNRVIQDAWSKGSELEIHGLVYALHDGLLRNLHINCSRDHDPVSVYESAVNRIKLEYIK